MSTSSPFPIAIAVAPLLEQVGCLRHVLHPPGQHHLGIAEADGAGPEHQGFQAAAADLVDGHGRNGIGDPRQAHGLPGRGLSTAAGEHLADDHFVDRSGCQAAAFQQGTDDRRRQLRARHLRQGAAEGTLRGA